MNTNSVFQFIGSKWFVLFIGLLMLFLMPTTYGNLMVVYNAGEMGRLWWVPVVFIINLITAIMALYKATGMFFSKEASVEEWDE